MPPRSCRCLALPWTLCYSASTGSDWFTGTGCMEVMCHSTLFEEPSCLSCPTSSTGPVLRPAWQPNAAGTQVLSLKPLGPAHRTLDHAPPARKAASAATSATSPHDASIPTPTFLPTQMSPLPLGPAHRALDHASPARVVPRAVTSVMSPDESSAGVSAMPREPTWIADYGALPAPAVRPFSPDRQSQALPVSLPLP